MKLLSSRRMVVAAALIVLALFLLRPGASRLKSRITYSISSALGRSVDIDTVHLRLLPRPGFDLKNLVVYDDPTFGAEPMLRASEVTAALRLTSLLRGRLEIARLDLTEPSLNLVHAESGRWNVEALLERTAHNPTAPTGKAKSEPRPGFPYIEASSARINFKSGPEKKPYALTNADFSLWQDSENSWGLRLKAQPFRTDLNLNDMGLLQVSGTWQRADAVRDTPLHLNLIWNRSQLGQVTRFFTGNDQGWRGEILLDVTLTGTPAKLQIASDGSIQDFRRYDITSGKALSLAAHCDSAYNSLDHEFQQLLCSAPVGSGLIALKGDVGTFGNHRYALVLTTDNLPASAAAALVQHVKSNLPDDLVATGTVSGSLRIEQNSQSAAKPLPLFEGRGEIARFHLVSASNKAEIGAETVPLLLTGGASESRVGPGLTIRRNAQGPHAPEGPRLEFGPFPVSIGRTASARGWINRGGYNISVVGDAEISKALRVARMLGLAALQSSAEGNAQLDLQITGSWTERSNGVTAGFSPPQVTGIAKLHNVHIPLRGAGAPVEVISGDVQLLPDEVRVAKLNATAAETSWTGSLTMPRGCGIPAACQAHFLLNTNEVALGAMREWVSPSLDDRPWYRVLQGATKTETPFLSNIRASGEVKVNRLQVQRLEATSVSAKVSIDGGKLRISDLIANFLGGRHRGEWQADFNTKAPVCKGSGTLIGASLADVADATKDDWIAGSANATYEITGSCPVDFWTSAEGTVQFDMSDGALPHLFLTEGAEPLQVMRFVGQAHFHTGNIEIKDARLDSPDGKFRLDGAATLKGDLDLKLARTPNATAGLGYTITGTFVAPQVNPFPGSETQAQLKPEPAK